MQRSRGLEPSALGPKLKWVALTSQPPWTKNKNLVQNEPQVHLKFQAVLWNAIQKHFWAKKTGVTLFSIRSKVVARKEFWSLQRTPDNFFWPLNFSLSGDANGFLEPAAFSAKKCPTCGLQVSLSKECSNVRFQLKRFSFNYNKITFLDLRMLVRWYFKMWSVNIDR